MPGQTLATVQNTKYLGVSFTDKLKWDFHIDNISGAGNRMLGFLWQNLKHCPRALKEKAYKAYMRPKLEYASSIWDPHHQKSINKLETVQHRAVRFVTNTPHSFSNAAHQKSISSMKQHLSWTPLQERGKNNRLIMFYRIVNNLVDISPDFRPSLREFQPVRGN